MIGQTLSHFRITAKLGEGGMGEVYQAQDLKLKREVALKVLPREMAESPQRLERFQREAEAVAALNHPNIVTIHSVEHAEGIHFLTMELVDGESLDQIIPPQGLSLAKVFSIAVPMADALAAAHEKGITHRDLKTANVMVRPDGSVKVLDFGLAKLTSEETAAPADDQDTELATATAALTGEGVVMGTAPYMSPEQLQGMPVDSRTDIFSLGIVLYEMAIGERPFRGESGIDLASRILRETPPAVTELRADLPHHLGRIIQHCLEKDPERRYQSAKDVRNELDGLRNEVQSDSTPSSEPLPSSASGSISAVPSEAVPVPAKGRLGTRAALGVALLMVAAGAWWIGRGGRAGTPIESRPPAASAAPSVAVLPFADLSPEKDQEYFTDGMTEELLQALGTIEGLKVPSRTAVFALKGKELDIQQVGERLGVETLLEGSVRKSGNQLRISTQLVQVSDGFKLWSETYDRELEDVFTVQDEIARSIADALRLELSSLSGNAVDLGGTSNSEAYDSYLRGQQYRQETTKEARHYARQMYERAVELDPDYALAWVRLARTHAALYDQDGADPADLVAIDRASARALALAPDLGDAHAARATYFERANEPLAAEVEFQQALLLDPKSSEIYWAFGALLYRQGHLERTAELWEKSIEFDPEIRNAIVLLPQLYTSLGREADARRAYERSVDWTTRHLELNPDRHHVRIVMASGLLALGQRDKAFKSVEMVLDAAANDGMMLYNLACFFSVAGEVDQAIDSLERSVAAGMADVEWLRQDSSLDNIRDDPRFQKVVERLEASAAQ